METRLEFERSSTWWVGALALGVSILLHVLLVRLNPDLLLGQSPTRSPRSRPVEHSVTLAPRPERSLERELPELLQRVEKEPIAETPDTLPDIPDAPGDGDFAPEDVVPDLDVAPAPVPEPPPEVKADPDTEWRPRQEVMAIARTRVEEPLEFLPRRFRDPERSRVDAPDVRLPGVEPSLGSLRPEAFAPPSPDAATNGAGGIPGLPDLDGTGSGGGGSKAPPTVTALEPPELAPALDEPEFEAVESLLRLQTRVWEDPRGNGARYFKIQLLRNGIESLPVMPREVVFLLDCSASMTEEKLRLARSGVARALDALGADDVFTIAAFRDGVRRMSPDPLPATVVNRARARAFLSELRAYGKTDVFSSLQWLTQRDAAPDRPVLAMVITDGVPTRGVMDTREILDRFTRGNRGRISVFSLGGGRRVNRLLLDFLSYRNRGRSLVSEEKNALKASIRRMVRETSRPVLADLSAQFTGDRVQVYPKRLGHLYLDTPLVLVGRAPADRDRVAFQIVGHSAKGAHDLVFEVDLTASPRGSSSLGREWGWQALLEELSGRDNDGETGRRGRVRHLIDTYTLDVPREYLKSLPPFASGP